MSLERYSWRKPCSVQSFGGASSVDCNRSMLPDDVDMSCARRYKSARTSNGGDSVIQPAALKIGLSKFRCLRLELPKVGRFFEINDFSVSL
jgi:hypothetical protein